MRKIKMIGSGRVVESLLSESENVRKFDLEIYSKTPRLLNEKFKINCIERFIPSDDIILVCTSVCEKTLLREYSNKSRETVFKSNIKIIKKYLQKGYFNKGKIFILTNPSELIAEYIFRKTCNNQIFALGQEMDIKRYKNLLNTTKEVSCLGQHFQYPIIQNFSHKIDQLKLRQGLVKEIETEFVGDAPPFKSGAYNIDQLLKSIINKTKVMVSSYVATRDCFLCGKLNMRDESFRENAPSTIIEKDFIDHQVLTSKKLMQRYL